MKGWKKDGKVRERGMSGDSKSDMMKSLRG